ncbi:hypothetical protein vseg_007136 [Gypsophila vaccaria]
MSHTIQPLRRSILPKTLTFLQFHQIQHKSQKPISYFPQFLTSQPHFRHFSSSNVGDVVSEARKSHTHKFLLDRLRNEIQYEHDHSPPYQPPSEFNGFKVDERRGEQWISLRKKYGKREEIKVEVTTFDGSSPLTEVGSIPGLPGEEVHLHITMVINIFKEGSNQVLEFICSAWPDSLEVEKLFVRERSRLPTNKPYTGPPFWELDDQLQDELNIFLEERGIDSDLCAFLHSYIGHKDKAEYLRWLESIESVIDKK